MGLEEATAGGGFIPLGAAWSSAGVLDLVIRLWGRATQRKSPLNSEEALKACSSLHQNRRKKGSPLLPFFLDAGSDTAGQYTKDERASRSFDLNPDSHCETSDWTIYERADAFYTGLRAFLPWLNFVSVYPCFSLFLMPWMSHFTISIQSCNLRVIYAAYKK